MMRWPEVGPAMAMSSSAARDSAGFQRHLSKNQFSIAAK
jgi:hypothetical protein